MNLLRSIIVASTLTTAAELANAQSEAELAIQMDSLKLTSQCTPTRSGIDTIQDQTFQKICSNLLSPIPYQPTREDTDKKLQAEMDAKRFALNMAIRSAVHDILPGWIALDGKNGIVIGENIYTETINEMGIAERHRNKFGILEEPKVRIKGNNNSFTIQFSAKF